MYSFLSYSSTAGPEETVHRHRPIQSHVKSADTWHFRQLAEIWSLRMAGLYEELKRRNVIRVAIAYVAVSWLLIQVIETLFPVYGLSDAAIRIVVAILGIGFIPVLIIAWVFELTSEGLIKDEDVDPSRHVSRVAGRKLDFMIIAVLVVALGFFAIDKWVTGPPPIAPHQWESSIAVLPFVHISDDPGNSSFSEGLSEEVLNLLAKVSTLKVIGRESIRKFIETNGDIGDIGQALGVKTVLQGSVRSAGKRVRIAAQLTDVSDGSYLWTENYDRTLTDIFAVQEDVAAAIIDALQIHVVEAPTRARPTDSSEAYALFLRARVFLDAQQGWEAIPLLLQATELDPNFAEAHELLAYSYWQQGGTSISVTESQWQTNGAAAEALTHDPDLLFAQALYQLTKIENRSDLDALEALERAWREQPNSSERARILIYELTTRGYLSEAHRIAVRFVELQPLSPVAHYSLGESLVALGQTDEAYPPLQLSLELDNAFASWFVPAVDLALGRDESAIARYEAALERAGISDRAWIRELVTAARDPARGKAYLDSRIPQIIASLPEEYVSDAEITPDYWYLYFGFIDDQYEKIFAAGPNDEIWTRAIVDLWEGTVFRRVGFTADPRYLEAAELLGIVDVWEHRGPPDFCEKIEGNWVCQ